MATQPAKRRRSNQLFRTSNTGHYPQYNVAIDPYHVEPDTTYVTTG